MGSELVSEEPAASQSKTMREIFDELCPHYMSMGMTYDEFWHGTPDAIRQMRKSYDLSRSRKNWFLWLQGLYNYKAFCSAHPLFNVFAPEGTKAQPYLEEAIPLTEKEMEEWERKQKYKRFEKLRAYMASRSKPKRGDENVGSTDRQTGD